jgi:hypothetical protein
MGMGMMQRNYGQIRGTWQCPMINDTNISDIYQECKDHMNGYYENNTSSNSNAMPQICQDNMREYLGQERTEENGIQHGCPMMH